MAAQGSGAQAQASSGGRSVGGAGRGPLWGWGSVWAGGVGAAQKFGERATESSFAHGSTWLSPAPQQASEGQDPELDDGQRVEDPGDAYHVNARHLLYPNSPVLRFPVPNEKVPWEVSAVLTTPTWPQGPGVLGDPAVPHKHSNPARLGVAERPAATQGHMGRPETRTWSTQPEGVGLGCEPRTHRADPTLVLHPPVPRPQGRSPPPQHQLSAGDR